MAIDALGVKDRRDIFRKRGRGRWPRRLRAQGETNCNDQGADGKYASHGSLPRNTKVTKDTKDTKGHEDNNIQGTKDIKTAEVA
jgi:hypothetical protein